MASFRLGDLKIPRLPVTYLAPDGRALTVRTEPVPVQVESVLANEGAPTLKDDLDAVEVVEEVHWPLFVIGGLIVALLGVALGFWLRRRWANRKPVPVIPPRPAHEVAMEALDALASAGFSEDADLRPFFFQVSEVVRGYFGDRYGFDGREMTTRELVRALDAVRGTTLAGTGLTDDMMERVEAWLSDGDLVKFAKANPSADQARGTLESAITFVQQTKAQPVPAPTPGETTPSQSDPVDDPVEGAHAAQQEEADKP